MIVRWALICTDGNRKDGKLGGERGSILRIEKRIDGSPLGRIIDGVHRREQRCKNKSLADKARAFGVEVLAVCWNEDAFQSRRLKHLTFNSRLTLNLR